MFGYVIANRGELTPEQKHRYSQVYCGICRQIRERCGNTARLGLSYDMAFLAALLMSLYEPEERSGENRCLAHPFRRSPWTDNEFVRYAADMNVALGYYNFLDDWQDDGKHTAKFLAERLEAYMPRIRQGYPRQCDAIDRCIRTLSELEKEACANPDAPAACFGELMGELLVYREDLWEPHLRRMGQALGRFIYLLDAALDYEKDRRKGKYNPYLAMGTGKDWDRWEEYLVLTMGRCTESYEMLPLVQDKPLLDNILYSGVWIHCRGRRKEEDPE